MDTTNTRVAQDDPIPRKWKTRWYRLRFRFLRRLSLLLSMPQPIDVGQALDGMLHVGIEIGMKQVPPIVYYAWCPYHEIPLYFESNGRYTCYRCQQAAPFVWFLEHEPHTDPHVLQAPRPFLGYRLEKHPQPSQETQAHRAVNWPKSEKRG